jgi:hypothetical protein
LHYNKILDEGGEDANQLQTLMAELNGNAVLIRAFDSRMLNQRGAFTVHWPPNAPIAMKPWSHSPDYPNLSILQIEASLKDEIRGHLDDYGIPDEFIYPDADGVADHVNWMTHGMIYKCICQFLPSPLMLHRSGMGRDSGHQAIKTSKP